MKEGQNAEEGRKWNENSGERSEMDEIISKFNKKVNPRQHQRIRIILFYHKVCFQMFRFLWSNSRKFKEILQNPRKFKKIL